MLKFIIRALLLLAGAGLFLGGIIFLGQQALNHLRSQDQTKVHFADLECIPPPGMTRTEFLDEVQYLAGMPAELPILEQGLPGRLAEAFAHHPWVEKVEQVRLKLPQTILVKLKYRIPVLAVPLNEQLRAVDRDGILLPANAPTTDLPVYPNKPFPPRGPAGTPWGDDGVLTAAQEAGKKLN